MSNFYIVGTGKKSKKTWSVNQELFKSLLKSRWSDILIEKGELGYSSLNFTIHDQEKKVEFQLISQTEQWLYIEICAEKIFVPLAIMFRQAIPTDIEIYVYDASDCLKVKIIPEMTEELLFQKIHEKTIKSWGISAQARINALAQIRFVQTAQLSRIQDEYIFQEIKKKWQDCQIEYINSSNSDDCLVKFSINISNEREVIFYKQKNSPYEPIYLHGDPNACSLFVFWYRSIIPCEYRIDIDIKPYQNWQQEEEILSFEVRPEFSQEKIADLMNGNAVFDSNDKKRSEYDTQLRHFGFAAQAYKGARITVRLPQLVISNEQLIEIIKTKWPSSETRVMNDPAK